MLLGGLSPTLPQRVPHAVYSLDWYHPTAAEEPGPAAPFVSKVRDFTLGWPLLRRCAAGIGTQLEQARVITNRDDVYFLTRRELRLDAPPQQDSVAARRAEWLRQRKLAAPLMLGRLPMLGNTFDRIANKARSTGKVPPGALVGHPASPGRARGRARSVEGPQDFSTSKPGEVLVAKATAPAWTPLFADAVWWASRSGRGGEPRPFLCFGRSYRTSSSTQSMDFVTAFFHSRICRSCSAWSIWGSQRLSSDQLDDSSPRSFQNSTARPAA